ncbi:Cof-type HAD-IIB family hydrolase [Salisediminibacterium selenitireducens]|uniref:Cof-like hydrolase n=1 Tax=Bacillus selenitireducens (strain ATCC 700615 / DSM 15326 / MLS10) TaxID=439292 RepID=D6XT97_BACIE|nr:Cof-type HAD-IIB family hydrolase [Salisediminibacterium selenitireducens]ADH99033.1 Cof-like hydrolase [[Bacillus] selenitireducens MLS10]
MKRHLIALDLDGTLLTDDKVISPRTLKTLSAIKAQGHHVVIATGRPYRASKDYYRQLGLDTPLVNFNGAFTHHPVSRTAFSDIHSPLDRQAAMDILEICESQKVENTMFEIKDRFYLRYAERGFAEAFTMNQKPGGVGPLRTLLKEAPTSILIHPEENRHQAITNEITNQFDKSVDQRTWGAPWNVIEIVRSGINKAFGLKKIADFYGIHQDQVIAFGDEDNDLEMIDYAGIGIAMENGIQPLKEIASDVTLSNGQDGVAHFLESHFKLNRQ